jgi:hypothetical protein
LKGACENAASRISVCIRADRVLTHDEKERERGESLLNGAENTLPAKKLVNHKSAVAESASLPLVLAFCPFTECAASPIHWVAQNKNQFAFVAAPSRMNMFEMY